MRVKSQKGSITMFVLIALLFYTGFLLLLYASNVNRVQTISEGLNLIRSIYNKDVDNIDDVYNRRLAQNDTMQPIINEFPTQLITNVTELKETYEEYGKTGGVSEYVAFNNKFSSLKEVLEYANTNNLYGDKNITINAYGNNGLTTSKDYDITIIRGMKVTNEVELNTALKSVDSLYISVANNIECANVISIDNVTHKLDLNNSTISYTKQNESFVFLILGQNAKLTVLDSSDEKQGNISANLLEEGAKSDGNDRENSIFAIRNNGELTIESGRISANSIQILTANEGTAVKNNCAAIDNFGIVNLNGGKIYSNIQTCACTYLIVKDSLAQGRGIVNAGTVNLNSGEIEVKAEASMVRGKYATVYGRTEAYAYGILNVGGTINNSNNVKFTTTAIANSEGTISHTADKADIYEQSKTISEIE